MSFQDYADDFEKRSKIGEHKPLLIAGIAIVLLAVFAVVALKMFNIFGGGGDYAYSSASESTETASSENITPKTIYVYVSGCVKTPGLIELEEGMRVATAIDKAGGFTEEADVNATNLAKVAEDGEQISIPSKVAAAYESSENSADQSTASGGSSSNNGKVNINTADATQLQTVSGIGPSKASKIIAYRESNGKFKSVDDLVNVSGIGEKTLASIKDQLCV